jgi:hypothetical protein
VKFIPETALDHLVLHVKQNYRTQTAAAHAWGVSPQYLNAVITGNRPIPEKLLDVIGWEWRLVPKEIGDGQPA